MENSKNVFNIFGQIYITNNEEVKLNDWFICLDGTYDIYKCNDTWLEIIQTEPSPILKIIASDDPCLTKDGMEVLSDEYVEAIKFHNDDNIVVCFPKKENKINIPCVTKCLYCKNNFQSDKPFPTINVYCENCKGKKHDKKLNEIVSTIYGESELDLKTDLDHIMYKAFLRGFEKGMEYVKNE